VVAVRVELAGVPAGGSRPELLTRQEEVAPGETLGRLLARLAVTQPSVGALYDPTGRALLPRVSATINGRAYNLLGGLTYTLHEGDMIALRANDTPDAG
jgi:hypothetical protein